MTDRRIRVVAIMTHPVQYLAPWFRHIHAHAETLDFKVVYATEATASQQGVGFGHAFEWDVPLRAGYESVVVRPAAEGVSLASDAFWGLDVPELIDVVRRLEPQVVLISGWHSITQVRAINALARAGIPLLYRGDTHLGSGSRRWAALSRLRSRLMLRQFSAFLAVGLRSREFLRAMGAADPAIVASPHAVDNEAFAGRAAAARLRRTQIREAYGFAAAQRVVLYAGKLSAIKRPADVIDAAAALAGGAVLFAGDGPERAALAAHARARGVLAVFPGFLNQSAMAEAYVAADALMVPGRETWGLVANEALACGLPVVLSDEVGSAPDLATPGVCEVVPAGDTSGFARALAVVADRQRGGSVLQRDCEAVAGRVSYAAATAGLVTAASFACRNRRRPQLDAPTRVLALCGHFVFAGGMERATFDALAALRRGGADVHTLLNGWSSRPVAELAEQRDLTWEVGRYEAPLGGVFRNPLRMARALRDVLLASLQLGRLQIGRNASHVLAADFRAVLLHAPALAFCRLRGVPVVLRSGVAPTPTALHAWLWRWVIRPLVSHHAPNSAFIAGELRAVGIAPERIEVISNVALTRRIEAPSAAIRDPHRIVYVGQVIPEKGVLPLLDAVAMVVARGYDARLDVVGALDGWAPDAVRAYRASVRARAGQPDLVGRIRFLGWREDVDSVLRGGALHCCPSQPAQREGFGNVVVEAKRAGIPSVVCPSGGLTEIVDHRRDGWITRDFSAEAIAEGLQWFLSDGERLASAAEAARQSFARFDPVVFEERWQTTFGMHRSNQPVVDALLDHR